MKLVLEQPEIEQAICNFVAGLGVELDQNTNVHVKLVVGGPQLTAEINITTFKGITVTPAPVAEIAGIPEPAVVEAAAAPTEEEIADDLDRTEIKKELDARGIEYLPKAHTSTLQTLLDEAKAAEAKATVTAESLAEDPPFAVGDPAPVADQVAESPFGQPAKSVEPEAQTQATEPVAEENKPLFGN